ncbi:MAG: type II toxin-antitoxin system PemK/MazF family toxin [Janthinobacterium lividum]
MPDFEVWDVVKVPFPYTNRPVQQRRPALVVACHRAPGMPALLWVVMITSAAHRRWPHDVEITDLAVAGLPAPSIVRPTKIATLEADDAERAGRLPHPDRRAVAAVLSASLDEIRTSAGTVP